MNEEENKKILYDNIDKFTYKFILIMNSINKSKNIDDENFIHLNLLKLLFESNLIVIKDNPDDNDKKYIFHIESMIASINYILINENKDKINDGI